MVRDRIVIFPIVETGMTDGHAHLLATFRSCPGGVSAGLAHRARFHPVRCLRVMHSD